MHAGDSIWMVIRGDAGMGGIILFLVIEERVLNLQIVGCKNVNQILASGIAPRNTIWPKYLLMFIAGACADPCINITANDNLCVRVD
jgi:hypothetical protein